MLKLLSTRPYAEDYIDVIDTPYKLARLARIIDTSLEAWLRTGVNNRTNEFRYNFMNEIYIHSLKNIGENKLYEWLHANTDNYKFVKYTEAIKPIYIIMKKNRWL